MYDNNSERKADIAELIKKINHTPDVSEREKLCDKLKEELYKDFEGVDLIDYNPDDGIITDQYINFDSNCGLTWITAQISLEQVYDIDALLSGEIDIEEYDLSSAVSSMTEVGDRSEQWHDLIDPNFYVAGDADAESFVRDLYGLKEGIYGGEGFKQALREHLESLKSMGKDD